jgi:RNase H-like domain found in reverse transcriptase
MRCSVKEKVPNWVFSRKNNCKVLTTFGRSCLTRRFWRYPERRACLRWIQMPRTRKFQAQPDGVNHPVGYWSRGLTGAERNYSTTEKLCLAIVWSILHLRLYLESRNFVVRTDHNSLRWVLNLADAQGRLSLWSLRLLEFDFEVQYSPGASHHAADTVSRLRVCDSDTSPSEDIVDMDVPCFTTSTDIPRRNPSLLLREDLILAQMADPACSRLLTDVGVHPQLDV